MINSTGLDNANKREYVESYANWKRHFAELTLRSALILMSQNAKM